MLRPSRRSGTEIQHALRRCDVLDSLQVRQLPNYHFKRPVSNLDMFVET